MGQDRLTDRDPSLAERPRLELAKYPRVEIAFNTALLKRGLDVVISGAGLAVLLPFLALVAVLIKLDSPGPVFYNQIRIGQERRWRMRRREALDVRVDLRKGERRNIMSAGRLFRIHKFRTMVRNAEDLTGPTWASPHDPRVTRVGGVLRALRVDELPQLWNVFKGEMSLVGPRPERPHFVKKFADKIPEYTARLRVRPGITGLAQVSTLDELTEAEIHKKLDLDLHYLRDLRLESDLRILLKTLVVLARKVFRS
ncbi:MAG: sugar transferase [Candidatus Eisenbacteria bacterium]|nr:sugar transferase [Candidatus Eisenbacteria bacterium]